MTDALSEKWARLSLAQRFGIVSLVITTLGAIITGWWIGREIEIGATRSAGSTTSLYVSSFVAPHVQELAIRNTLSSQSVESLDRQIQDTPIGERVVSIKMWSKEGRVLYSNQASLIGQSFPIKEDLAEALNGEVHSSLSNLDEEENVLERQLGVPLVEIYAPVRDKQNGRVIAALEFYERADDLVREIQVARSRTWLTVALASLGMFGILFAIVRKGSNTIAAQQSELSNRLGQVSGLLEHNEALHNHIRDASFETTEINERLLRRMSGDLHDGPAQGIGFALLKLDSLNEELSKLKSDFTGSSDLSRVRSSLQDALKDIRNLSSGMALPELDKLSLRQTITRAARAHEQKTESRVVVELDVTLPENVSLPLKINVYRFLQEALSNAFRHASGEGQMINAKVASDGIEVVVSDRGNGFDFSFDTDGNDHLGLVGMRRRVESLGGKFSLDSSADGGTRVQGIFPV